MMNTRRLLLIGAATICAIPCLQVYAQEETEEETGIEFISLKLVPTTKEIDEQLSKDRPKGPSEVPVPKYVVRSDNGKFLMTIGGHINPIMGWDIGNNLYSVKGAGLNFTTQDIPVPAMDHHKCDFFLNPLNTAIDFQIVGFAGTKDQVSGYVKFATNGSNHNLNLNKAYVTWRGFTAGMKHTLMYDGDAAQPTTIDTQGPSGKLSSTVYEIGYTSPSYNGFRFAAGIDIPSYYSSSGVYRGKDYPDFDGSQVASLYANTEQMIPDIPAWVEYTFSKNNRIRLSGMLRNFAYYDLVSSKTRYTQGWGVMLSGNWSPISPMVFSFQAVYGKGMGAYIQDISGMPVSYIPTDSHPGRMSASPMMGIDLGVTYNLNKRVQINAFASEARIWDIKNYATVSTDDCNYKYGLYAGANVLYKITSYLQWGVECLWGHRQTWDIGGAHDTRIQTEFCFTL